MADVHPLFNQAPALLLETRRHLIDALAESLHQPNLQIDDLRAAEAEARLAAYRSDALAGVPMEEIFRD